jgi:MtrB/PioB family decaheme-associated outer membrane protein
MKNFDRRSARTERSGAYIAIAIFASLAVLQQAAAADKPAAAESPAATAEDPAVAALTQPTSTVEIGAGNISNSSYKFGEYNGLEQKGGFVIGNMDMHGGARYDSDSATRWDFRANDLGLQASDATFDIRNQGLFKLDFGLSDWRHNISDTYQSPYQGLGSTVLTLPPDWLKPVVPQASPNLNYRSLSPVAGQGSAVSPRGQVVAPTASQMAALDGIVAIDRGAFHPFNLHTERKQGEAGFQVNLSPSLLASGSFRHETKDGFQQIGAVTSAIQENSVILPDVVDTTTDQFNLGLQYTRNRFFLQAGYYGSIFKNNVTSMSWQDPNDPSRTASMSSAPNNQFHQLNLAGGFNLSGGTRLVADLSYARSKQDAPFLTDASLPLGLPVTSADASVVTKLASIKLTTHPTRKLGISARFKYDDRDNQTPVSTFVFYDVNIPQGATSSAFNSALGLPAGALSSNVNIFSNRPQSKKDTEFDLESDYSLGRGQKVSGGYQWQKTERRCDGTWINCSSAPESIDRTLHAEWHGRVMDDIEARLSYGFAERRVRYDSNAWLALVPMATVTPGSPVTEATTSVYGYLQQTGLTGFGPLAGYPSVPLTGNAAIFSPNNNIVPQSLYGSRDNVSELPGMRRFNLADRNRNRLRFSMDWQTTERLSLTGNAEFDDNEYLHSVYGLQKSTNWSLGVDGTYAVSDRFTASAFYTHENQRSKLAGDGYGSNTNVAFIGRAGNTLVDGSCYATVQDRNNNGKLDPCLNWSSNMHDRADTIGTTLAWNGLWRHRLDLSGDVIFTRAQTDIDVNGASYANNPFALKGAPVLPADTPAVFLIPAANLPPVVIRTFELRLSGRYALTPSSDVRLMYEYARTKIEDFAYEGLQPGTGTEQMPTLEQAPNYVVQVVTLYYRHRF